MRSRASAPAVLAAAAALAGVVGVVSALTPSIAARSDLVQGLLPPDGPRTARILTLALGFVLIWLSRALARRKRRAWQLAVVFVALSALAHLAKGLDFEEAFFSTLVLAALWRGRGAFTVPGGAVGRPLLQALAGIAVASVLLVLRVDARAGAAADLVADALTLIAFALAARALYVWLRPVAHHVRQTPAEREQATRIVREFGRDSLSYFALRRDKSYFFSPSGRSFLAYRVLNGTALVSGDPIGDASELAELLAEFQRLAQARAWRLAVVGASDARLPLYRAAGLRPFYLGDEAVVIPERFSLEGRRIRKVRQSVARLERAGFRVEILAGPEIPSLLRSELHAVSCAWRGPWPERGFGMAMDALFAHPESLVAVALDTGGCARGFVQLVPAPASGGWSLAAMRRDPETPNGLMEFLLVRVVEWAHEHEVPELSLNFAVFGAVLRGRAGDGLRRRTFRRILVAFDGVFQLERLLSFSSKFQPIWRRRYVCIERLGDAPLVGLAYLHAESLLTPPGPWSGTRDLANH